MKLPETVIVGYRTYDIEDLPSLQSRADGADGWHIGNACVIQVRTENRQPADIANTLLHEILHACWQMGDLEAMSPEEKTVTVLANQLIQVWRKNSRA
jgi:hypothetical protein